LLLGPAIHAGAALANRGGFGFLTVAIPAQASLLGLDVFWQGAALEQGGPLFGVAALTNGLRLHIGD
jgi:hypothetical protein